MKTQINTDSAEPPSVSRSGDGQDLVVRLSVTPRCQLRCTYCMPEKGNRCTGAHEEELSYDDLGKLIAILHQVRGIKRVRFTGGEPLLRRDLPALISVVRDLGIAERALTTNAQLLKSQVEALREAGLQRVNVSLDSLDPIRFSEITRGGVLDRTLEGIGAALKAGLTPVKLNTVVIRGVNDREVGSILRFGLQTGCHVRFLELKPIGVAASCYTDRFMSTEETRDMLQDLGYHWESLDWDRSETSRDYFVRDNNGRSTVCGFISPSSLPFCSGCRRVRVTSSGELHGCLARASRFDLKQILDCDDEFRAAERMSRLLDRAFSFKKGTRQYDGTQSMAAVGG